MTFTDLMARMRDEYNKLPDYRKEKPIGIQILYMLENEQIILSQDNIDYLATLDKPLEFLIVSSQKENTYDKFSKNIGYNVRHNLKEEILKNES